ncbi:MAG TPA: helix-turn-helix transcriptional regulator [Sediminibacterium sp.]
MNNLRDDEFLLRVGGRIRELREKRGMSMEDLGAECGIERNTVFRIEKGKVNTTICTLNALAKGLGVSVSELMKII